MVFQNNVLSGAGGSGTAVHTIDQSIRFNSADKAFITQDSGGSFVKETTSTISMWVKRAGYVGSGTANTVYGAFYGNNGRYDYINFNSSDQIVFGTRDTDATTSNGNNNPKRVTTQRFRDPSAWYHLVVNLDSTNAVASERIRIYVNGARITAFDTETTIPQNRGFYTMSDGVENNVGAFQDYTTYNQNLYFDGYLAEVALIDGTAYGPENFGEYNSSNIWIPKDISGLAFGSNGIYYKGQDSSALGDDSSGNTNAGTVRNLAAHDQVLDTPTNNFAVLNPLNIYGSNVALAEGNLKSSASSTANDRGAKATQGATSGKWYFEVYFAAGSADNNGGVGVSGNSEYNGVPGETSDPEGFRYGDFGSFKQNGSATTIQSVSQGDVMMVAFDVDNSKAWFGKNGTFISSGDPAGGNNPLTTTVPDLCLPASYHYNYVATTIFNFGQEGTFAGNITAGGNSDGNGVGNFKYSVPSGYLALCTKNLGS